MGYRDDFYVPQNIIGYTGNINNYPTVYFLQNNNFGHITQKHDFPHNVGREEVRYANDYTYQNNANDQLEEWFWNRLQHTSRNKFISVAGLGHVSKLKLNLAISHHKTKKLWGDLTPELYDAILYGPDKKGLNIP